MQENPRNTLAQAYGLAARLNLDDTIFTHLSTRNDDRTGFFLAPFGLLFEEVTPTCLQEVALGNAHTDTNPAGAILHGAVYEARKDAYAVVHLHTPAAIAVSSLEEGLLPLSQFAMLFYQRLGYHDFEGISLDPSEKARLATSLATKDALLLRNHGLLTVADTMPRAFMLAYYLERSCQIQLMAQSTGRALHLPPHAVCEHTAQQFEGPERASLERAYTSLLRRL